MEINSQNFDKRVLQSDMPVMVEFWASWCPPCKRTEPILKKLQQEYADTIKIAKINVDRNPKIAKEYNVKGVPTFIVFHNGECVTRDFGAKSKNQLQEMIKTGLKKSNGQ